MLKVFQYNLNTLFKFFGYPKATLIFLVIFFTSIIQIFGSVSIIPIVAILLDDGLVLKFIDQYNLIFLKKFDVLQLKFFFGFSFLIVLTFTHIINIFFQQLSNYVNHKISIKYKNLITKKIFDSKMEIFTYMDVPKISLLHNNFALKIGEYANISLFIIKDCLVFLLLIILIATASYQILFILLFFMTFLVTLFKFSKSKIKKISNNELKYDLELSHLSSSISYGFKEISLFNLTNRFLVRQKFIMEEKLLNSIRMIFLNNFPRFFLELLFFISILTYFLLLKKNNVTINELPYYAFYILAIIRTLPSLISIYKNSLSLKSFIPEFKELTKLEKLLFSKKRKIKLSKKIAIKTIKNNIEVKNLKYQYFNSNKIFSFNFKIPSKKKCLIAGKSGIGKTTFINLLLGMLKPKSGEIIVNGKNILDDMNAFSNIVSIVGQFNFFFAGSIMENICFKEKLNFAEKKKLHVIYNICGLNQIIKDFESLKKYNLFQNASNLSGGQRQRISLARSLFQNPKLLIIDEGLNALDKKSEIKILKNLKENYKNLSLLYITHRPRGNYFDHTINLK